MRVWFALIPLVACHAEHVAPEPSLEVRSQAALAYDRGTESYDEGHFAEAGEWFLTSYGLVHRHPALIQAVRSYRAADNFEEAGTLALLLAERHPDEGIHEFATAIVDDVRPHTLRVTVDCENCQLEIDGRVHETRSAFVSPGAEHRIYGHFGEERIGVIVSGAAGEERWVEFEASPGRE
ncbi:MAG: hypothetical protein AAGE52_28785 [Myxococcota bacterium]